MANPANETIRYPFTAFNFAVEVRVPGVSEQVCSAAFSECDGLEMSMDVRAYREKPVGKEAPKSTAHALWEYLSKGG